MYFSAWSWSRSSNRLQTNWRFKNWREKRFRYSSCWHLYKGRPFFVSVCGSRFLNWWNIIWKNVIRPRTFQWTSHLKTFWWLMILIMSGKIKIFHDIISNRKDPYWNSIVDCWFSFFTLSIKSMIVEVIHWRVSLCYEANLSGYRYLKNEIYKMWIRSYILYSFSLNIETNVGKEIFKIIDNFPQNNILATIINISKGKLSYRTMKNMNQIITSNNAKVQANLSESDEDTIVP